MLTYLHQHTPAKKTKNEILRYTRQCNCYAHHSSQPVQVYCLEKHETHVRSQMVYVRNLPSSMQKVFLMEREELESESYVFYVVAPLLRLVGGVLLLQWCAFDIMMRTETNYQTLIKKNCPEYQYLEMAHYYTNQ